MQRIVFEILRNLLSLPPVQLAFHRWWGMVANLNASSYETLLSLPKPFGVTCHSGTM